MLTAIVGINWGDEGKGRMVDLLSQEYKIVVRYQGGNNAGHTVVNEKGKFIDTADKKYLAYGFEAIRALKGKIPFFEVNTGAISRGYRTSPYPQTEFLKEFKNQGFGAVITSDCHNKSYLDCYYKEARELLLSAGFKTIWKLTDDGFKETEI